VTEPISRATLNIVCRAQRFKRTRIGSWHFWGPAEFIDLVDEARKRLEVEDPALLRSMTVQYTVIYSPRRVFSFPCGDMVAFPIASQCGRVTGVLAAWIYLYYHSLALTKGRWFLSQSQNSITAGKDAEAKTRQWLIRHGFPGELCQAFEGSWSFVRFDSWLDRKFNSIGRSRFVQDSEMSSSLVPEEERARDERGAHIRRMRSQSERALR
jgi:hypothetical protein